MRLLGGQSQQPSGIPASADFGSAGTAATSGQMMRPEDLIVSPDPTNPHPPDVRMEGFRRLTTDFTYSLGQGLSAASQNPVGRSLRTTAGMGAILQVPEQLQKAKEAQAAQAEQQKLAKVKVLADILQNQQQNAHQQQQEQQAKDALAEQAIRDAEAARHNGVTEGAKTSADAATLRAKGFKKDADGNIIPVPRSEMSDAEISKLDAQDNLDQLRSAQKDLAIANTDLARAKADPNSPLYKDAQIRQQQAERRLNQAQEALGMRQQGLDLRSGTAINKYYDPAVHADDRLSLMMQASGKNYEGTGGQGDYALLFNHIGMTLSAQKGARINNAEVSAAIAARSLPESILAQLDKVANGKFLSPDERRQMVENGISARDRAWYTSRREARLAGMDTEPETDPTLPALKSAGPANPAKGAPIKLTDSAQKPIEQYSPSSKQYRYSTDGGKTWSAGRAPQ